MNYTTKKEATAAAKKALALIKIPGFEIDVNFNMSWYWSIRKNGMNVMMSDDGTFWTLFSSHGSHGGEMYWSPPERHSKRFKDPNKAIAFQLALARSHVRQCQEAIESVLQQPKPKAKSCIAWRCKKPRWSDQKLCKDHLLQSVRHGHAGKKAR